VVMSRQEVSTTAVDRRSDMWATTSSANALVPRLSLGLPSSTVRVRVYFPCTKSRANSSQKAAQSRARLARGAIAKACERLLRGSSCSIATAAAAFSSSRHFVLQLRLDDPLAVANGTTSFVADVVATMALQ